MGMDVTLQLSLQLDACSPCAVQQCLNLACIGQKEILWQCRGCQAPALEICDLSLEKKTPPHYAKKGKGESGWARMG